MKTRGIIITDILCAMAMSVAHLAQATPLIWDANNTGVGQTDGTGTWLGANQWWDGSANATWNNGTPDDAVIGNGTAGGTITVGAVTAGSIVLTNFTGTYTFDGTAGSSTLSQSGGITIFTNAANVTFKNTVIAGTGGITKENPGLLILGANPASTHTYTGQTVINNGVVMISGEKKSVGNFTLNNGMLTDYYQSTTVFTNGLGAGNVQIQIYGDSGFGGGNGNSNWRIGAQNSVLTWGSTYFNPTTLKFRAPQGDNNGPSLYGQVTLQNRLDLNSGTRTIDVLGGANTNSAWAKIDAGIQDTGSAGALIKSGAGILILGGTTSTWGGNTTVGGGLLAFDGNSLNSIGGGSGRNISVAAKSGIRISSLSSTAPGRIVQTDEEIYLIGGNGNANNYDFSSAGANLPKAFLGHYSGNGSKGEYTGTITPASDNYRLGTPIGMSGLFGIRNESVMSGSQGLIVGGGSVELVGPKTFTGDTVLNNGARLGLAAITGGDGVSFGLQNSVLDTGTSASTGTIWLESVAGPDARVTGAQYTTRAVLGGLKGSRSLYNVYSTATGSNNGKAQPYTNVVAFIINVAVDKTNTYSGNIGGFGIGASGANGGAMTLTKTGPGTQVFAGKHTYTNATIIEAGTFELGAHNVLTNSAPVSIGNGTLDTSTYTNVLGVLEVTGSTGAIHLGAGGKLAFANSSAVTWSGSELAVTGDYVQSSSLRFGTTSAGLTSDQLAKIKVVGGGYATLDANGYLKTYKGLLIRLQ